MLSSFGSSQTSPSQPGPAQRLSASPSIPNHGPVQRSSVSRPRPPGRSPGPAGGKAWSLRCSYEALENFYSSIIFKPPSLSSPRMKQSHSFCMCHRCSDFIVALSLLSYSYFPPPSLSPAFAFSSSISTHRTRSAAASTAACCRLVSLACCNKIRGLERSQRRDPPQCKADV